MSKPSTEVLPFLFVLTVTGCAASADDAVDPTGAQAAMNAATSETVLLKGTVVGYGSSSTMLDNVSVCVGSPDSDAQRCVLTDAEGKFSVPVAAASTQRVLFSRDGYFGANQRIPVEHEDFDGGAILIEKAYVSSIEAATGVRIDPTKGHAAAFVYRGFLQGVAGVSFVTTPASGLPFYLAEDGTPDPSLQATTRRGVGGVVNVEPGEATFQALAPTDMRCEPVTTVGTIEIIPGNFALQGFRCR